MSDFRQALRFLLRSPGFVLVSVLSLALGIGAGTAIFSVVNAVLLRSLPVPSPSELRQLAWKGREVGLNNYSGSVERGSERDIRQGTSFPYPAFSRLGSSEGGLSSLVAFSPMPRTIVSARGVASVAAGSMVSGNFFAGYGGTTLLGRPLAPEDAKADAPLVVVLTYRAWERLFGLDPGVLGQTLTINQNSFTVVGVLSREFSGPSLGDPELYYVTFAAQPTLLAKRPVASSDYWWVQFMGRVGPGVDERRVEEALSREFRSLLTESDTRMKDASIRLLDGSQGAGLAQRRKLATPLWLLLAAVGIVLAIACANVAGLLIARGTARNHDFAIRAALGSGRWRLLRLSLTESLLLGLAAAGAGILVSLWIKNAVLGFLPEGFTLDAGADLRVLTFAVGLALLSALAFGLLPALRAARVDPIDGLKGGSGGGTILGAARVLVALQMVLCVLLVSSAGLTTRSFVNIVREQPGFAPENLLTFRLGPSALGYQGSRLAQYYENVYGRVASMPGVVSVGFAQLPLVGESKEEAGIRFVGAAPGREEGHPFVLVVHESFAETLRIPLLAGRGLAATDTAASAPVALVNEAFAKKYFPNEAPLGSAFETTFDKLRYTIVGVVRDTKYSTLREDAPPLVYFSFRQAPPGAVYFAVRTAVPPITLVPELRSALASVDPNVPLSNIRTQEDVIAQSLFLDRLFAGLCGALGALALLLAGIGLYGLISFIVARKTPEIGVRMALGADSRDILGHVLREALLLAAAGLLAGVPLALALGRLLRSRLYGIEPTDFPVLFGVCLVLFAAALAAAWGPARRASKIDPVRALRAE